MPMFVRRFNFSWLETVVCQVILASRIQQMQIKLRSIKQSASFRANSCELSLIGDELKKSTEF